MRGYSFFNFEKTMVSVLLKQLSRIKSGEAQEQDTWS